MNELQELWDAGEFAALDRRIGALARTADDFQSLTALGKWRRRLQKVGGYRPEGGTPVKVALLGNATTNFVRPHLELMLEAYGIRAEFHEAEYDSMAWEFLHADSGTAKFAPQVAIVVQSPQAIHDWPAATISAAEADSWCEAFVGQSLSMLDTAHRSMKCDIILDNYHALATRPFGNLAAQVPGDRNTLLRATNRLLARRAPDYMYLHDVEALAAHHGVGEWVDQRLWHQAKQPMSFQNMVAYARSLARLVASMFRGSRKCLVVDLDNTLWGGVVGDDGVGGLEIGPGSPVGEAFAEFQQYLRRLGERGVILAVCSKNEDDIARAPFEELPDMVLGLEDFAAFRANWNPKPENIRAIAEELNIGVDSIVFADDNPAERALVEQMLPEVGIVELNDEPADYASLLDASAWFELPRLSAEDASRNVQYRQNAERTKLLETTADYDGYLRSLEQRAVIRPFEESHLDRITQLVNKTNQFNLTTLRHNRSEVAERMQDEDYVTACIRLADRFGDNGLISVCYGKCRNGTLDIEQWLMSCRVFKRGVEQLLMNWLAEQARERGARKIRGRYIPTEKKSTRRRTLRVLRLPQGRRRRRRSDGVESEPRGFRPARRRHRGRRRLLITKTTRRIDKMNKDDIWNALTETIRDNFEDGSLDISADTTAADVPGWDSIAHVELMIAVEERFGVRFTTGEAAAMKDVGHMAEFIGAHLERQAG